MLLVLTTVVLQYSKNSVSIYVSNEKSSKLKNVFSSPRKDSDLQKLFQDKLQSVMDELKVINSNVLYITYRIDKFNARQQTLDAKEFYEDGASDNNPEGS